MNSGKPDKIISMIKTLIALLFLTSSLLADVKSTTGEIKFNTEIDNQAEMILNSTGLGIGITPSANLHVSGNTIISDQLFIGGDSGSSNLNVNGTLSYGFQTITSSIILSANSLILADTSSENITLSLPEASSYEGRKYIIKKTSTLNRLSIRGGGFIDDYSDLTLSVNNMGTLSVISSSGNWHILNLSGNGTSIQSDNLIGWWKMDEINSNTLINEINLYPTKIFTVSAVTNSNPSIGDGRLNQGIDLDGSGDNFYLSNSNSDLAYLDNAAQISMSIWVKLNNLTSDAVIISKGDFNSNNAFVLWRDESAHSSGRSDTFTILVSDGSGNETRIEGADGIANDNEWTHIVVTYQGDSATGLKMFINGTEDPNSPADTSNVDNLNSNPEYFRIGRSDDSLELNGNLDELRIFNKVLSNTEIEDLYNQGQ